MDDFYYYGSRPPTTDKWQLYKQMLVESDPKLVAIDTESVSIADKTPLGVSIAITPDDCFYFPTYPEVSPVMPWKILSDPSVTKVMHNALHDLDILDIICKDVGIVNVDNTNVIDTAIIARMLLRPDAQLQWIAWEGGKQTTAAGDILKAAKAKDMLGLPPEVVAIHCCQDAMATLAVYKAWEGQWNEEYMKVEMGVLPLLQMMSNRGIKVDQEVRQRLEEKYTAEVDYLHGIASAQGFNPASSQQVGYILAKRGNFLPFNRKKPSRPRSLNTSEDTLEFVDDPIAGLALRYRKASKLLSTYILPLKGESRAYTHFHLDAITSRVSSRDRNMQNIPPGEVRNMYLPDTGIFSDFDYSQIELRVLAYLSGDLDMNRIYQIEADIHTETAAFMNISRRIAKNVNFGMIYGATASTLRETAKIRDIRRCEELIFDWFAKYKRAGEWIKEQQEFGRSHGYIETIFGRKIRLPVGYESDDQIDRKAVNYPIQASAAEIMKRAMLMCKHLPMALQVHDELIFDGKVELPSGLDEIAPLRTPITVKEIDKWE